ncbi:MAG: hypothetical protein GC178_16350 [Flavobacteriales bacterium]|nr:hypothetical protein [Flavobacteriales bacterium]
MEDQEKDRIDYANFERDAIEALKNGKELGGKDGVLAPMLKRLLEAAMEGEMDAHLKDTDTPNRRNSRMGKKVKRGFGSIDVNTPRDRNSSFEPEILPQRIHFLCFVHGTQHIAVQIAKGTKRVLSAAIVRAQVGGQIGISAFIN